MKIVFLILTLALAETRLLAQETNPTPGQNKAIQDRQAQKPEDLARKESEKAEKRLGLDAGQKSKWYEAALVRIQANRPLIEQLQGSTTPGERKILRDRIQSNGKAFDQSVTAMLSSEQNGKWMNRKAEKKKQAQKKAKQKKQMEDEFED